MTKKKMAITAVSVVAVCAISVGGILLYRSRTAKPVDVYKVESLNSASWYGEDSQLTGTVTSDFIQEVYQDTSQTIKKVYVKEGDKVKVGDKLLKYDIEEKEIELKLQQLQIKGAQYEIERLEKELETLKKTRPVSASTNATGNLAAANDLLGKRILVAEGEEVTEAPATTEKKTEATTSAPKVEKKVTKSDVTAPEAGSESGNSDSSGGGNAGESGSETPGSGDSGNSGESGSETPGSGDSGNTGEAGSTTEAPGEAGSTTETPGEAGSTTETPAELADYSKVDKAIARAYRLHSDDYTNYDEVTKAIDNVKEDLTADRQSEVDAMAEAINKAINNLERKPELADYSEVDKAIAKAGELNKNNYKDFSKVEEAVAKAEANRGLGIEHQKEVKAMADAINNAIKNLVLLPADYSKVDKAIERVGQLNKDDYKDFSGVEKAVKAVVRGLKKDRQSEVDAMAQAIFDAWLKLEKKDATGATVLKISLTSGRSTVEKGNQYGVSYSYVSGKKPTSTPEWWVWQQRSEATTIKKDGGEGATLSVASDESSTILTIAVIVDDEVAGTLDVTVEGNTDDPGNTDNPGSDEPYGDEPYYGDGYGDGGTDDGTKTYTSDELKDAIAEKESDIAKKKQELNEAKINYKEAKREVNAATVKATVAGTVTTAYTKSSAPSDGSAIIVVKAEDGIYVETAISEMALSTVKVGGTLTCTSWDTNETYEASVVSIADYPTGASATEVSSNPNSSYYKVIGFISEAGNLSTSQSVNISYNSQSMGTVGEETIYLHKAYVRTEGSQSYIYKKGSGNRLEKQYIKTGKTVSGSYIEVLSGVKTDDEIAFPYGKDVKEGAKTKEQENLDNVIF